MIGKKVRLRAVEPSDLPLLYEWENDVANWEVSNTMAPFSKCLLEKFIETSSTDLYVNRQMRLMIEECTTGAAVGAIDVFDFDPPHRRAGVGILIAEPYRRKGYGLESVQLVVQYLFDIVKLHQVFCNIMITNQKSLNLFQMAGFEIVGLKKDWVLTKSGWVDEYLLQILNKKSEK